MVRVSNLKHLIENDIPLAICYNCENRWANFNVTPVDKFIAIPRKYTTYIKRGIKSKHMDVKSIVTVSLNSADEIFLENNLNKFIKNDYNFDLQLNHISKFESLLLNEYSINNKYDLERNSLYIYQYGRAQPVSSFFN